MRRLMMGCVAGAVAGFGPTDFSYTGSYTWVQDDTSNWRLKFLTSGTFTPLKSVAIDAFLVGGGSGGRKGKEYSRGGGGGTGDSAVGGSDGSDGGAGTWSGGVGQRTTTREFGEATGTLYAGGGAGGGEYTYSPGGTGGSGGGGHGGTGGGSNGVDAIANTGGGGGGGGADNDDSTGYGASGGSGILIIRNRRG